MPSNNDGSTCALPACIEMFVIARVGTILGLLALAVNIASMADEHWAKTAASLSDWEGHEVCRVQGYGSTACLQWERCDAGDAASCTGGVHMRGTVYTGLWRGTENGTPIVFGRIFSVVTALFVTLLVINRAIAGTGDPSKGPIGWIQPPCPTCMAFGFLQALLPILTVVLFAAEAHSFTHRGGPPEFGSGFALAICACVLHTAFFICLVLSHYAPRDEGWWRQRAQNPCCALLCCLAAKPEDEEAQPDGSTEAPGGRGGSSKPF